MTNGLCVYCGCDLTTKTMTVDHVIPRARGGRNELSNLVPSCAPCNSRKGSLWITNPDFVNESEQEYRADITGNPKAQLMASEKKKV